MIPSVRFINLEWEKERRVNNINSGNSGNRRRSTSSLWPRRISTSQEANSKKERREERRQEARRRETRKAW